MTRSLLGVGEGMSELIEWGLVVISAQ